MPSPLFLTAGDRYQSLIEKRSLLFVLGAVLGKLIEGEESLDDKAPSFLPGHGAEVEPVPHVVIGEGGGNSLVY